jgi:predicted DNA-binding ribbon-helix-helix protein
MTSEAAAPAGGGARILKRSIAIAGHRTSVSLEEAFWSELKRLASSSGRSISGLIGLIDAERGEANLSSAIRVYVLQSALQ